MSRPNTPTNRDLWYGDILVGRISDLFYSESTWFGVFHLLAKPEAGELARRVVNFVLFCEAWNERLKNSNETGGPPPEAAEFDDFSDIINSRSWTVRAPDGETAAIVEAPVFLRGGDVTWHTE
jgi:hypothetical protein